MNVTISNLSMSKDVHGRLHLRLAFERPETNNISKELFDVLQDFAINAEKNKPMKWFDVHPTFSVAYRDSDNTIEFMEKKSGENFQYLPRALVSDWRIIKGDEAELLSLFIRTHHLVEDNQSSASSGKYAP